MGTQVVSSSSSSSRPRPRRASGRHRALGSRHSKGLVNHRLRPVRRCPSLRPARLPPPAATGCISTSCRRNTHQAGVLVVLWVLLRGSADRHRADPCSVRWACRRPLPAWRSRPTADPSTNLTGSTRSSAKTHACNSTTCSYSMVAATHKASPGAAVSSAALAVWASTTATLRERAAWRSWVAGGNAPSVWASRGRLRRPSRA
mmetsp:Transcript_26618/g.76351  ORF Transcript_26618/g.76351 Transcript_26618/m.76351 type:complete len:203 (+) Transcript_26618:467-1075(+)